MRSGELQPWRSAAEIIDWTLPCPSIFDSKEEIKEKYGLMAVRPLKPNTMRRIIRGVDKFTIKSGSPFIVQCNHAGTGHMKSPDEPLGTVLARHTGRSGNSLPHGDWADKGRRQEQKCSEAYTYASIES